MELIRSLSSKSNGEKGSTILEFALVVPLVVSILAASVEFSNLFRAREFMTLIAKEAGNLAYRKCYDRDQQECVTENLLGVISGQTTDQIDACIQLIGTQINDGVEAFLMAQFLQLLCTVEMITELLLDLELLLKALRTIHQLEQSILIAIDYERGLEAC